jgi:hypothetical protein
MISYRRSRKFRTILANARMFSFTPYHQYRVIGVSHDFFSDAAEYPALDAGATMG